MEVGLPDMSGLCVIRPDEGSTFNPKSVFDCQSELDSVVMLTKSGDSDNLYARDIIKQPLSAHLVTISAYQGTAGRTYSGEGLVGLRWAFLRAGAHSVIAPLWEVNDNSTPQLMDELCGGISKGTSPDVALRDAKLALLHSDTVYESRSTGPLFRSFADRQRLPPQEQPVLETRGRSGRKRE